MGSIHNFPLWSSVPPILLSNFGNLEGQTHTQLKHTYFDEFSIMFVLRRKNWREVNLYDLNIFMTNNTER